MRVCMYYSCLFICTNSIIHSDESLISNTNMNYAYTYWPEHHTYRGSRCDAIYELLLESALIRSCAYLSARMNFARCGVSSVPGDACRDTHRNSPSAFMINAINAF